MRNSGGPILACVTAFSGLDIILQPPAPSIVDPGPFSRVSGYFSDEELIISPDMRFQLVSYFAR